MKDQRISERVADFCIRHRAWVVGTIAVITIGLFAFALRQQLRTQFADLIPPHHPYIAVHNKYKNQFGGSNIVSILIEARHGDIFQPPVLRKIRNITRDLRTVPGVNEFQIISLASPKLKQVHSSTYGIESRPLMWPDVPETPEGLAHLREAVLANPVAYGAYVSTDLRSALVTADFYDDLIDYETVFQRIQALCGEYEDDRVAVTAIGQPILRGWVSHYLPQTLGLFALTFVTLGAILFFAFVRTLRGTLIPLANALVTGIWALGLATLLGLNFDPLAIVIAFLITARVTSHCVQAVTRFEGILAEAPSDPRSAAQASLAELWKPGILSVVTDAGGILVVAFAPIPLLQKAAYIGGIWVLCISITGVILTPVLLSWIRNPAETTSRVPSRQGLARFLSSIHRLVDSSPRRKALLVATAAVLVISTVLATRITVGDVRAGSPLLWPDHQYNVTVDKINHRFLGTDRMFVVAAGESTDAIKDPAFLRHMQQLQRFIELQPEVGGTLSIADLLPAVYRTLNEGNPRYLQIGSDAATNGELLYMYLAGSEPGDLDRFVDSAYQNGSVLVFLRDHKGETIRTLISRIQGFLRERPLPGGDYKLAGGLVGVLAAVNEVIFSGQIESIALALLVILVTCSLTYRSTSAGLFFMVPVILSNSITFAFMVVAGIGLNVSSLPVAALGIGLGVDYAIYMIDAIREAHARQGNLRASVAYSYQTAGRGIVVTATPLIACTALWALFSSLRFQAEMAILIALWMAVSALAALVVMPALVFTFRPRFILAARGATEAPEATQNSLAADLLPLGAGAEAPRPAGPTPPDPGPRTAGAKPPAEAGRP